MLQASTGATAPAARCGVLYHGITGGTAMHLRIIVSLIALSVAAGTSSPDISRLREGDIIFQETLSRQARAIKLATHSRYSHAGILFRFNGRFQVLEAVQPVRITGLNRFIRRGVRGEYVIKRLRNAEQIMTSERITQMKRLGRSFLGKNYDIYFEWSDKRLYCTELIWKLYHRTFGIEIGNRVRLKDLDLSHPYVQRLLRIRYGKQIPADEPVITPGAMFHASQLETVLEMPSPLNR